MKLHARLGQDTLLLHFNTVEHWSCVLSIPLYALLRDHETVFSEANHNAQSIASARMDASAWLLINSEKLSVVNPVPVCARLTAAYLACNYMVCVIDVGSGRSLIAGSALLRPGGAAWRGCLAGAVQPMQITSPGQPCSALLFRHQWIYIHDEILATIRIPKIHNYSKKFRKQLIPSTNYNHTPHTTYHRTAPHRTAPTHVRRRAHHARPPRRRQVQRQNVDLQRQVPRLVLQAPRRQSHMGVQRQGHRSQRTLRRAEVKKWALDIQRQVQRLVPPTQKRNVYLVVQYKEVALAVCVEQGPEGWGEVQGWVLDV